MKFFRRSGSLFLLISLCLSQGALAGTGKPLSAQPMGAPPTSKHDSGKIVWHDLVTDDAMQARQFYTELFGWEFRKTGSDKDAYYLISNHGKPIGGLVPLSQRQATGDENQWISYFAVSDVAQAARYAGINGGKVLLGARRFETPGELAVLSDPEGAAFGVLKSPGGEPVNTDGGSGKWIWADLMAHDPKTAAGFYRGIAGYSVGIDSRHPEAGEYFLLAGTVPIAGVIPLPGSDAAHKVLPNWLPYLQVSNLSAAVAKAVRLGGRIIVQPAKQAYGIRFAIIADPGGAAVGLVEVNEKSHAESGESH